jgi:hypothetical protein
VWPSEMKTASALQMILPCPMRSGQTSFGPRSARVITPSAATVVPRSWNSPPVVTTGASISTSHTTARAREARPPALIRADITLCLRAPEGAGPSYRRHDEACKGRSGEPGAAEARLSSSRSHPAWAGPSAEFDVDARRVLHSSTACAAVDALAGAPGWRASPGLSTLDTLRRPSYLAPRQGFGAVREQPQGGA